MKPTDMRIALLIGCDNVSNNAIEGVLSEVAKHGTVNAGSARVLLEAALERLARAEGLQGCKHHGRR